MAALTPSLATRLLLRRCLRWSAVATVGATLLVLLVDWVEHGSRIASSTQEGGPAVMDALRLALLLLPGHLARAAPLVAVLGAALTMVGLLRSGEWQALATTGLGNARRLGPFLLIGALAGGGAAALDAWVAPNGLAAHDRAMATRSGRPLRTDGGAWLASDAVLFHVVGDPHSGRLGPVRALSVHEGRMDSSWAAETLRWQGDGWIAPHPVLPQRYDEETRPTVVDPWARLPPPEPLAELIGSDLPAARSWSALREDTRPGASAERFARLSRPLACPLAALVGAALPTIIGAGSLAVLVAATPVLAWELAGALVQTQAAAGVLPPAAIPAVRLGLALLIAGLLVRRLRRP